MIIYKEKMLLPSDVQDIVFLHTNQQAGVKIYVSKAGLEKWILKKSDKREIVTSLKQWAQELESHLQTAKTINWKEFILSIEIRNKPSNFTNERYRAYLLKYDSIDYKVSFLLNDIINFNISHQSIALWDIRLQQFVREITCETGKTFIVWLYRNECINRRILIMY